jgi:SAM-dependent methyltransferase
MAFRQFRINWRLKSLCFQVIDQTPFGDSLYYVLQRYVTKTQPRILSPTILKDSAQIRQISTFVQRGVQLESANLFEFGAGWDLYSNFLAYCCGVNSQLTVDVRRWARAGAMNSVIRYLQEHPPPMAVRTPSRFIRQDFLDRDLLEHYGIQYCAPADARKLDVAGQSFDLIVTTSVLEHISPSTISEILVECKRILKPNGFMSHAVDFSDHYAHSDGGITEFNYLKFSDKEWNKFNPSIHFQNRLRRPDYENLFRQARFDILEEEPYFGDSDELKSVPVDERFASYCERDLQTLGCFFLLRTRPGEDALRA